MLKMYVNGFLSLISEVLTYKTSLSFKCMRILARFQIVRRFVVSQAIENLDEAEMQKNDDLILQKSKQEIYDQLVEKGYADGISISKSATAEIRKYTENVAFSEGRQSKNYFNIKLTDLEAPSKNSIYSIDNPHLQCGVVKNLAENSFLPSLAKMYLGENYKLLNSQIWYTFPQEKLSSHHNFGFHYDVDDYKFLKFFFYLSDVGIDSGPHIIIPGTQSEKSLFKFINRRITDRAAKKRYQEIITMTGPAGEGFAEDTFCYHKGEHPLTKRLILQIQYGLNFY